MLACITTAAVLGLEGRLVEVQVDIAHQGLPNFFLVGLPTGAVKEARERVRTAIKNSGLVFPLRRITVNLAPAELPKQGPSYDLPLALAILVASGQVEQPPRGRDVPGRAVAGRTAAPHRRASCPWSAPPARPG